MSERNPVTEASNTRCFIVTFDEQCHSQALLFSRPFPQSFIANPDAFFQDGCRPEADLEGDLKKVPAKLRQYVVSGACTYVATDTGFDIYDLGTRLRFRGPEYSQTKAIEQELLQKVQDYIREALESENDPVAQKDKLDVHMLPAEKGSQTGFRPSDVNELLRNDGEANIKVNPLIKPADPNARPESWNAKKERMFRRWLKAGRPGEVGCSENPSEQFLRYVFNGLLEEMKRQDMFEDLIERSKGPVN